MGVTLASGQVSSYITGSAVISAVSPIPLTLVNKNGSGTIATVPANKLWRIYYLVMSMTSSGSASAALAINGVNALFIQPYYNGGAGSQHAEICLSSPFCFVATAGQTITHTGDYAIIGYTEEAV